MKEMIDLHERIAALEVGLNHLQDDSKAILAKLDKTFDKFSINEKKVARIETILKAVGIAFSSGGGIAAASKLLGIF